jgi:hypothetical protein
MRKTVFVVIFLLTNLIATPASSRQNVSLQGDTVTNLPFKDGEKLRYVVKYKWGAINTEVGEFTFETVKMPDTSGYCFYTRAEGTTYKFYDLFFKVRDYYEAKFSPELRPLNFRRDIREGKYTMKNDINFLKGGEIRAVYQRMSSSPRDTSFRNDRNTFDIISLIFQMRNIDYRAEEPGKVWKKNLVMDGKIINLSIMFRNREVKSVQGTGRFNTVVLSVAMHSSESFKGGENMLIWITDDKNKIPVQIESSIKVGSVVARLKETGELKYPLTSKIK